MKNLTYHTLLTISLTFFQLFCFSNVRATEQSLYLFKPASIHDVRSSTALPSAYAAFLVNKKLLDTLSQSSVRSCIIPQFHLPTHKTVVLELERFDILSPQGYIVEGTTEGDRLMDIPKYMAFRGKVRGYKQSYVFLTVFSNYCIGSIDVTHNDGTSTHFTIKPDDVNNDNPITIVGDFSSDTNGNHFQCGAENLLDYHKHSEDLLNDMKYYYGKQKEENTLEAEKLSVHVAVECDNRFFKINNTTVALSANYAIALLGAVSAIYQRDASVNLQICYLRIWTTISPYPSSSKGGILEQFQSYWSNNMNHITRSIALLLTDNSIEGGIAYTKTLCNKDLGYAVSGLNGYFSLPSFDYTWDIDVTAHELGHTFGSAHTHECLWDPPVDSCAYPNDGNCIKQTRASRGTIMSYCHLNGSIELRLHPRIATLMRFYISQSQCISRQEETLTHDIASIDFSMPATGGYYDNNKPIPIKGFIKNCGKADLQNITVTYTLKKFNQETISVQTRIVKALTSTSTAEVTFDDQFINDNGVYQIELTVNHDLDEDSNNNTIIRPIEIGAPYTGKSISLTYPSGGEKFQAGEIITIAWNQKGLAQLIIDYSTDGGIIWRNAVFNTGAPSGTCTWKIPSVNSDNVLLRVKDIFFSGVYDIIKKPFTITMSHDIETLELIDPISNSEVSGKISPIIAFRNNGIEAENNIPVKLRIIWRNTGTEVYNRTQIINNIPADSTVLVSFPEINPMPSGNYILSTRCFLSSDKNPDNDSLGRIINIKGYSKPIPLSAEPTDKSAILFWKTSVHKNNPNFILYRGNKQGTLLKIKELSNTSSGYIDKGLTNGTEYFYAIIAESFAPETIFVQGTKVIPQSTSDVMPEIPTLLYPIDNAENNSLPVSFQWSSITNAIYYQLQVSTDKNFMNIVRDLILKENSTDRINLALDFRYFWRVRSINKFNNSEWSQLRSFSTAEQCPTFCFSGDMNTSYASDPNFSWDSKEVTVEFWNYFESKNIQDAWAFTCGDVNNDFYGYFRASVPHSDGNLYWDYGYINFGARMYVPYMDYSDKWTHIALTADGDSMRIYLDGILAESTASMTYPNNVKGFILGAAYISNNLPAFVHNAKIDEFRIWNKARSAGEIRKTMYSSVPPHENLMAYWRFDEKKGTLVEDASGNQHNLLLNQESNIESSDAPIMCSGAISDLLSENEQTNKTNGLLIIPNPAYNTITISTELISDILYAIEIYSNTGERIASFPCDNKTQRGNFTINIDSYENGLYNCIVRLKNGFLQSTFIIAN